MNEPVTAEHVAGQAHQLRKLITLLVVSASTFMLPLDYTVVAVALHDIEQSLDASFIDLQWVINGYTLAFASFVLASGSLADLFGRRRVFLIGMAIFGLSSLASGLAINPLMLNVARGALGIGAALMYAASLPLLVMEFEGKERAKAFGIFGAVVGIGAAVGPFLGGVIISTMGWRWAFLINVPVIVILVSLTLLKIKESKDPNSQGVDWIGLASFTSSCFLFFYAIINGNDAGWDSSSIIAVFLVSALLMAIFIVTEMRIRNPMIDLHLFRSTNFIGANTPPIILAVSFWSLFLYFPLYYQSVLGYSALEAGAAVLPFAVPMFFMGPVGAWLASRISSRALLSLGQLLVGTGAALMLLAPPGASWVAFFLGAFVSGCGNGLINGEMNNVALSLVPPERSGMASGINGTSRQVGIAIGFAGLGAVLSKSVSDNFQDRIGVTEFAATLASKVIKGDFDSVVKASPTELQSSLLEAARLSMHQGFQTISTIAAIVGFAGAAFSYAMMKR